MVIINTNPVPSVSWDWFKEPMGRPLIDQTGKVFGERTVIGLSHMCERTGRACWYVVCICGKRSTIMGSNLGHAESCGCILSPIGPPYMGLYKHLLNKAKIRGISMDITYEQFLEFTAQEKCHYCYASVKFAMYSIAKNGTAFNLDRMVNDAGYSKSNCVVCCARCNFAKADRFTYEDWYAMTGILRERVALAEKVTDNISEFCFC